MTQKTTTLAEKLESIKAALQMSALTFSNYAEYHRNKPGCEGQEKAYANQDKATEVYAALATLQELEKEMASEEMVEKVAKVIVEIAEEKGGWDRWQKEKELRGLKGTCARLSIEEFSEAAQAAIKTILGK